MKFNWKNRELKVLARDKFFEGVGPKYNYLTLPGGQCLDIETGMQKHVISPKKTTITAVERDKETFDSICRWFAAHWKNARKKLVYGEMSDMTDIGTLDLVFLDYLGNPTHADAFWIKHYLAPSLVHNAHIGITVSSTYRRNTLYPAILQLLRSRFPEYYLHKYQQVRDRYAGICPPKLLKLLTTYRIMISCYLFPNHHCEININCYKEPESTSVMALFTLMGMKLITGGKSTEQHENKNEQHERQQIHDAIDDIVRRRVKGIKISTVSIPIFSKENQMSNASSVIESLRSAKTTKQKKAATQTLNRYANKRAKDTGSNPVMVRAGILARIKRMENQSNGKCSTNGKCHNGAANVIDAIVSAKTAGQKAAATKLLNHYVTKRAKETGSNPVMVRAGINARITRMQNAN